MCIRARLARAARNKQLLRKILVNPIPNYTRRINCHIRSMRRFRDFRQVCGLLDLSSRTRVVELDAIRDEITLYLYGGIKYFREVPKRLCKPSYFSAITDRFGNLRL